MRILALDIETAPNLAYVWSLFDERISHNQLASSTEVICFGAKWLGEKPVYFYSDHANGHEAMVRAAHELLSLADVVIHYNGKSFDIPHLNREFAALGLAPPAPYQQIDLYTAVKNRFRFPSYKLDYVAKTFGVGKKVAHSGFGLWLKCMAGDEAAWKKMERYNRQDVVLLEKLYDRIQPWIPNHPSRAAYAGEVVCPGCASAKLQRRGYSYTLTGRYQRFQCVDCGRWTRATRRESGTPIREAAIS